MLPTMVSAISVDEHAQHICVASHMSGRPDVVDLLDGSTRTLPSLATGEQPSDKPSNYCYTRNPMASY